MKLSPLQQYGIVTANYWAFTLTDGALRMLVVFHFHQLGYSTLEIAFLFLFYEFFGVLTNLYGGWIGARYGLRLTLWAGTLAEAAQRALRDGGPSDQRHRQGPQQDERQERHQNRGARNPG